MKKLSTKAEKGPDNFFRSVVMASRQRIEETENGHWLVRLYWRSAGRPPNDKGLGLPS